LEHCFFVWPLPLVRRKILQAVVVAATRVEAERVAAAVAV
jgi:hypothetical protein